MMFVAAPLTGGCGKGPKSITEVAADYEHDVARRIKRTVEDDARREALLALENDVNMCLLNIEHLYVETGKQLRANPLTAQAQAESAAALSEARKQQLLKIGRLRMEMRRIATKEEWRQIFATD
jgi:hypothetical protein